MNEGIKIFEKFVNALHADNKENNKIVNIKKGFNFDIFYSVYSNCFQLNI